MSDRTTFWTMEFREAFLTPIAALRVCLQLKQQPGTKRSVMTRERV